MKLAVDELFTTATKHSVVYTATHDHSTTVGWFTSEPGAQTSQSREAVEKERKYVLEYVDSDGAEIHWDFIRLALSSVAHIAIFPLQDVLGLGTEARMNMPGTTKGNWEWRFTYDMLTCAASYLSGIRMPPMEFESMLPA